MPITVLRVSLGASSVKKAGRLAGVAGAYAATSLRVSFSTFMLAERYLPLAAAFLLFLCDRMRLASSRIFLVLWTRVV